MSFNPSQPRDENGRWAHVSSTQAMALRSIAGANARRPYNKIAVDAAKEHAGVKARLRSNQKQIRRRLAGMDYLTAVYEGRPAQRPR